jgi:lauroyl/myristoyl acyltransferase
MNLEERTVLSYKNLNLAFPEKEEFVNIIIERNVGNIAKNMLSCNKTILNKDLAEKQYEKFLNSYKEKKFISLVLSL